jgi:hypothetical protein
VAGGGNARRFSYGIYTPEGCKACQASRFGRLECLAGRAARCPAPAPAAAQNGFPFILPTFTDR